MTRDAVEDGATPAFDPSTRPQAPALDPTPAQRGHGRRLAAFHAYHLSEMDRVGRAIALMVAGEAEPSGVAASIADLKSVENIRLCGALCGRECQMLTLHHTIEDEAIFPALRGASAALRPVLDRLAAEHLVIHALIEDLAARAASAVARPDKAAFDGLRETFRMLDVTIRSHFGYEERQIGDALGVYNIAI